MPIVRVYIQSEFFPDIKLIEINDEASMADLKKTALKLLPEDIDATNLELSIEDDDGNDSDQAHPKNAQIKDILKEHGVRVHLHHCKQINVSVRFGAEEVHHQFSPATTIGRIRQWAGHDLGMQPNDIAEHVLQITGTSEQPDVDTHIGSLTSYPACSVTFDLVPAHRING